MHLFEIYEQGKAFRPTDCCRSLARRMGINIVLHATDFAVFSDGADMVYAPGKRVAHPRTLTGGGDHFNAGYCLGDLFELPIMERLLLANATSGYYVMHAKSPTLSQAVEFMHVEGESGV